MNNNKKERLRQPPPQLVEPTNAVSIPYGPQDLVRSNGLEPQTVKQLAQNRAQFILNVKFNISSGPTSTGIWYASNVSAARVRRLAVTRVVADIAIPNINSSNNYFEAIPADFPAFRITVTVPPGYYSASSLVAEVVLLFNASATAIGSAARLSATVATPTSSIFNWVLGGANVTFLSTPNSLLPALGIIPGQLIPSGSVAPILITYVNPYFVRYLDISSRTLQQDSKIVNPDQSLPGGFLCRVYLNGPLDQSIDTSFYEPVMWTNCDDRPLNSLDISISPNVLLYSNTVTTNSLQQTPPTYINAFIHVMFES